VGLRAAVFTPYHSQYLAYRLTLEGIGQDAFARSLSTARVEMKPHQVDAALFALKSPLSKGAILADEVGLGKTIEAGLVIAQRWAEQRRRILLIVPASLRKQWTQELQSKFSVQCEILESKSYRERQKAGNDRPFEVSGKVVVTSYEFAARQADEVAAISWDLVVFDEAHRLRNVARKNGSKRAKDLRRAVQLRFKILLTATPLQNTLLELFGLVSVIDDKLFGDEKSFKARYGKGTDPAALAMLRERLQPVSRRMLRKQVHDAGHINYTARHSHTFQFEPDDKEVELYELVSAFLQRKDTIAFGDKPNQLVTLVVRKILGSSTAALVDTLGKIRDRLKKRLPVDSATLSDIETVDEMEEEIDADEDEADAPVDAKKLATEIAVIEGFIDLAKSIGANAKGEKLVRGLPTVLKEIVDRGGNRKAVIFTESVRTQRYLHELLSRNGFENDIALMNGSNSDPESKAIYADWLARHKGSDAVSGSKTADMKAAIVEAFRDKKSILIATESGAEGINLQFCSLVVNFDLPWNPQRVEQRIGRCHRYGQKIDVTVVNMLNLKNKAEVRVHELLREKFKLFSGVFGASDEVLGVIEKGVDFERKVLEIVQNCRSEDAINAAFQTLEEELQASIDADMLDARNKLMTDLDQDVVRKLKHRGEEIEGVMSAFDQMLITRARAELPGIHYHHVGKRRFDWDGKTWTVDWAEAERQGWNFFRLTDGNPALKLVEKAKARELPEATLELKYSPVEHNNLSDVQNLIGTSGWLTATFFRLEAAGSTMQEVLLAGVTDDGDVLEPSTAARLFLVPGKVKGLTASPPEALRLREQGLRGFRMEEAERRASEWLNEESDKLDRYGEDLEASMDAEIDELDDLIRDKRRASRQAGLNLQEKLALKREVAQMDEKREELIMERHARKKRIRTDIEKMLDKIERSLKLLPEEKRLFTIRWTITQ
jgi:superfamily II DNA or RNA helicase